jgi:hypothetical protein
MFKNLVLAGMTFLVMCVLAELVLRAQGTQPASKIYRIVDRLEWTPSFIGFPDGTFRANPKWTFEPGVVVNSDGFRGVPLRAADPKKTSIAVIGDSFVWGASANPITKSFPDLLNAAGYQVFNLGIPGTGPIQYRALAERYAPIIRPDFVLVALYLGNDIKPADPLTRNHPLYYVTNAGWLQAHDAEGRPLGLQEAYRHFIGGSRFNTLKRAAAHSVLITKSYRELRHIARRVKRSSDPAVTSTRTTAAIVGDVSEQLQRIEKIAVSIGARFGVIIIPAHGAGCEKITKIDGIPAALRSLPLVNTDVAARYFRPAPDCHIDNNGHRFIATQIANYINAHP